MLRLPNCVDDDVDLPILSFLSSNLVAAQFRLMKMRPARGILDRARAEKRLQPGSRVIETSSGTFALALAILCAQRDYRLTIVSADSLMDDYCQRRLRLLGAQLDLVADPMRTGQQEQRLLRLGDLLAKEPASFWPNQYGNPENPASYAKVAELLLRRIGRVDCLVASVGSGGSLCGTARALRLVFPHLHVIAVDTHNSVLFGHPAGPRRLRGLGNTIIPANLDYDLVDEVHWVGWFPAMANLHRLHIQNGMFAGPTSGAASLVGQWYARENPHHNVVALCPDEGHRYIDNAYSDEGISSNPYPDAKPAQEPRLLDAVVPQTEHDWSRFLWRGKSLDKIVGTMTA